MKRFHLGSSSIKARMRSAELQTLADGLFVDDQRDTSIRIFPTDRIDNNAIHAVISGIKRFMDEIHEPSSEVLVDAHKIQDISSGVTLLFADAILADCSENGVITDHRKLFDLLKFYKNHIRHSGVGLLLFSETWKGDPDRLGYGYYPNTFVSAALEDFSDCREDMLSVIAAHEMGHVYGLTSRNFNVHRENQHCAGKSGTCLMRPDISKTQLKKLVDKPHWLCPDCQDNIAFIRQELSSRGVSF